MQQNIEERLWEYIDGTCSAADKLLIDQLVADNVQWKNKHQELLELHALLGNHLELDEPSMRFTQNVMENIGKYHIAPAAQSYINKRVIRGIAAFFIISIVGFLLFAFLQVNWSQGDGTHLIPGLPKFNVGNKIDFSKLLNNTYTTIFMMINIVLGLVLLDMYLTRKKTEIRGLK